MVKTDDWHDFHSPDAQARSTPPAQPPVTIRVLTAGGHAVYGQTEADWRTIRWGEDVADEDEIWLQIREGDMVHNVRMSAIEIVTER